VGNARRTRCAHSGQDLRRRSRFRSSASASSAGSAAPAIGEAHAPLGAHLLSMLFLLSLHTSPSWCRAHSVRKSSRARPGTAEVFHVRDPACMAPPENISIGRTRGDCGGYQLNLGRVLPPARVTTLSPSRLSSCSVVPVAATVVERAFTRVDEAGVLLHWESRQCNPSRPWAIHSRAANRPR
jgi:hypothetical protein